MWIVLLLLLLLVSSSQPSHYFGTVMTYYPKATNAVGSMKVVLYYKLSYHSCVAHKTWVCLQRNCGTETSLVLNNVHQESEGEWCQREAILTREVPTNVPFQLKLEDRAWFPNTNGVNMWRAVTLVELRNRSDTGKANRSPQTTILPAVRVPTNCVRNFRLLAFDSDGDEVKCRYGNATLLECSTCTPPTVLNLSSSCTLTFRATNQNSGEAHAVQLVMEDFPRQTITLTQTNGSTETITTNKAISKLPIQFVLRVDPEVLSCTEGLYLPKFLPPTPANGDQLFISSTRTLNITIKAQANSSTISELLLSGPSSIQQKASAAGEFVLTWTPSADKTGESHPICFVVQAIYKHSKYHSELRCVIARVDEIPKISPSSTPSSMSSKTPSTPAVTDAVRVYLRLSISSSTPLSEDYIRNIIIPGLEEELMKRRLPPGISDLEKYVKITVLTPTEM